MRRLEEQFPPQGGAPEPPPLPRIELMWERRQRSSDKTPVLGYTLAAMGGAALFWAGMALGWL